MHFRNIEMVTPKSSNSSQLLARNKYQSSNESVKTIVKQEAVVPPINIDRVVFSSDRHHHKQVSNNVQVLHSKLSKATFINKAESLHSDSDCPSENSSARLLNNSLASATDFHAHLEAKLHRMQFERVFLDPSHKRDDLCAYFIKKYQIAQGLIPDPKIAKEERRRLESDFSDSTGDELSEMSNFSMEIQMLNKLHVEKNNPYNLRQLPIMIDHLLPDP